MIEAAETVALLADSAKFSMAGMIWVTDARSLDAIVTDAPVPPQCDDAVDRFGVEVTIA
jgi:DeoR/GlpR family transcriptional regulator of sugar metabolism